MFRQLQSDYDGPPTSIGLLFSNLNIIANNDPRELKQHIEAIIINSGLVDSSQPGLTKTFKLSVNGFSLLKKHGSYSNYVDFIEQETINRKELEIMSHAKQWYETENAKKQYDDYPETKKRLIKTERLSKLSIAIALATLLQQWLCNNHN